MLTAVSHAVYNLRRRRFFCVILFVSFLPEIQHSLSRVATSPFWMMLTGLAHYFLS
jgi:hypothetical protein